MSIRSLAPVAAGVVLLALLGLLTGCAKITDSITLKEDGSGTLRLSIELDVSKQAELVTALESFGLGDYTKWITGASERFVPGALAKRLEGKEGVRLVASTISQDPDSQTWTGEAEIAFDSLDRLYDLGLIPMTDVKFEKLEGGSYRLTRTLGGDILPSEAGSETEQLIAGMLGMLEPYLSGMEMTSSISVPAAIAETNGAQGTGNLIVWKMGFADIPKAEKRRQVVTFGKEGLELEAFEVKSRGLDDAAEPAPAPESAPEATPEATPEDGAAGE